MAEVRVFSWIGGNVVLDLINTVSWRLDEDARTDGLEHYSDLLGWAAQAGVISDAESRTLRRQASGDPAAAGRELGRFRQLREDAYTALIERSDSAAADLLRRQRAGLERTRLVREGAGWAWVADPLTLATPGDRLAREVIALLTSAQLDRLHQCADVACGWVYLDTSPRRNRRWCVAEDCGNRNRARRFYARQRAGRSGS